MTSGYTTMFRLRPWVRFFYDAISVIRARTLTARYLSNEDLVHAVDLEVIKARKCVFSEFTETRDEFSTKLLERDVRCLWTGVIDYGARLHIIPPERGPEVRSTIFWEDI
jgi:hypothetical protein